MQARRFGVGRISSYRRVGKPFEEIAGDASAQDAVEVCDSLRLEASDLRKSSNDVNESVRLCLSLMQSHASNVGVQKSGTLALCAISEKCQQALLVGECGGVEYLLDACARLLSHGDFVKIAIVAHRSLCLERKNRERFCAHHGIETLTEVMKKHKDRRSIQRVACALLSTLTFENEARRTSAIVGGTIPLMVESLHAFDPITDPRLHANACMALRNLAVNDKARQEIIKSGRNIAGICRVLLVSNDSSAVQEALGVLQNVVTSSACVSALVDKDCRIMSAILNFLRRTMGSKVDYERCHEFGFALVRSFVLADSGNDCCVSKDEVVRMSVSYLTEYMTKNGGRSAEVISQVCMSLRTLLISKVRRLQMMTIPDGIDILVQSVAFLSSRPDHVEHALIALGNAVFDSSDAKRRVRDVDGIKLIAEVMKANQFSASVTEASLMAVQAICSSSEENGIIATSLSLHSLCVKCMTSFSDNPIIEERALAAITSLGNSAEAVQALHETSAVDAAKLASSRYPYSKPITALTTKLEGMILGPAGSEDASQDAGGSKRVSHLASKLFRARSGKSFSRE